MSLPPHFVKPNVVSAMVFKDVGATLEVGGASLPPHFMKHTVGSAIAFKGS